MPPKLRHIQNLKPPAQHIATKTQIQFGQAVALHQQGRIVEAQVIYEAILRDQPKHIDALHLLGVAALQLGNGQRAADFIAQAINLKPDFADAHLNHGSALKALKQFEVALASYEKAISIKPDYAEAYYNRGIAFQELKQFEAALASYDKAISIKPDYAKAYSNRGIALKEFKQFEAALASYNKAISIKPDFAEAYLNRGIAFQELKQFEAALASYDKAISIKPDYAEAYYNRGNALNELKQFHAALASYDKAISIKLDYTKAYSNRGNALNKLKQFEAALASYDKAISIKPDDAEAYSNRGIALQELKQFEAALASYDKAISLKPDHAEAYSNRGIALNELEQFEAAIASYDKAISIKPDHAEAFLNKSLALLLIGEFGSGWPLYEWRWRNGTADLKNPAFTQPLWLGAESLHGKTILLWCEQGLGDTIQFIRYAALVAEIGGRVIASVPNSLMRLLSSLDGVSEWVEQGGTLPAFDFHCPLLSLPLAFKTDLTSIPSSHAYLRSDINKVSEWSKKLGTKTKPRVGIVWSGSTGHKKDQDRSIALSSLIEYLPEDCEYVSLQKELRDTDSVTLAACSQIKHFGDELGDFTDTAALCDLMDVVISVDTSVAHLSGALGKPTWVLLPHIPDWRWLLDREDSPWYPSIKLYRQGEDRHWSSVLKKITADLLLLSYT